MTRLLLLALLAGCDGPDTRVVIDNQSPAVVYRAFWQAVSFQTPVAPGASSDPQSTVAASENPAYALLAPGWDPTSSTAPASFLVVQSRSGFAVHLDETLHIPVGDETFAGDCAAGSALSEEQADFITRRVFARDFSGLRYDAASCTTIGGP